MTDNEIIKAFECCIKSKTRNDCETTKCPACTQSGCYFINQSTEEYPESLIQGSFTSILDLINRQKAEIERAKSPYREYHFCNLLGNVLVFSKNLKDYNDMRKGLKSEAIKEFAEKLKQRAALGEYPWDDERVYLFQIDDLVKEMTEDEGK